MNWQQSLGSPHGKIYWVVPLHERRKGSSARGVGKDSVRAQKFSGKLCKKIRNTLGFVGWIWHYLATLKEIKT